MRTRPPRLTGFCYAEDCAGSEAQEKAGSIRAEAYSFKQPSNDMALYMLCSIVLRFRVRHL